MKFLRQKERGRGAADGGYILVFVLGMLLTIGLLLSDVSRRSHLGGSVLLNSSARIERRVVSDGALEIGKAAMMFRLAEGAGAVKGAPVIDLTTEIGGYEVLVEVRDECGKLDLKTTDSQTFARLLSLLGEETGRAQELSKTFILYRNGLPTNGPGLGSLDELLSLDGFDAPLIYALTDVASVDCPRRTVAVWTAPQLVLESLKEANLTGIAEFVSDREDGLGGQPARRANLGTLSQKPGTMTTRVGPVYTIRSSLQTSEGSVYIREQLVMLGSSGMSDSMILRTTSRRMQEG